MSSASFSEDIKAAYSHHHQNNNLLFCGESGDCISVSVNDKHCIQYSYLPFPKDIIGEGFLEFHGISNGLLFFCYSKSQQIYLWNPVIRKYKTLPDLPCFYDVPLHRSLTFGYLPKINDYKIINIGWIEGEKPESSSKIVYVYVYSLSTNSWKKVSEDKFSGYRSLEEDSVVVKGVAYWVGNTGQLKVIICFDIENEIIREIMLPPQYSNSDAEIMITLVQRGSGLSLFCLDITDFNLDIWILEKEAETKDVWTKKITLNLDNIKGICSWWPEGFRNDDEIILTHDFWKYITYDIEKKEPTEIFGDLWDSCSVHHVKQPIYVGILAENLDLLSEN